MHPGPTLSKNLRNVMRLFLFAGAIVAVILGLWVISQSYTDHPSASADPRNAAAAALAAPTGPRGAPVVTGLALVAGGVIVFWMAARKSR